jgi:predicted metal-dependent hydrolase
VARRSAALQRTTAHLDAGPEHGTIEYHVIRSTRRKRTIELAVERGEVLVRAPERTPDHEIAALVRHRAAWIARHRARTPARPLLDNGCTVPYLGQPLELTVTTRRERLTRVERDLLGLRVTLPQSLEPEARESTIRDVLARWLRERACEDLAARAEHWARELGWTPRRVLVRDQRRRWGSCAPDGTLRLNWRLVMLDEAIIDYVVVHELAHLRVANHSPRFWALVAGVLPDHRDRRRALREAGRGLPL